MKQQKREPFSAPVFIMSLCRREKPRQRVVAFTNDQAGGCAVGRLQRIAVVEGVFADLAQSCTQGDRL